MACFYAISNHNLQIFVMCFLSGKQVQATILGKKNILFKKMFKFLKGATGNLRTPTRMFFVGIFAFPLQILVTI